MKMDHRLESKNFKKSLQNAFNLSFLFKFYSINILCDTWQKP